MLAGTLLFGVSSSIGMLVGQNAVSQRFMGNLKLLITMPVSKGAYVLGSLAFSSILDHRTFLVVFGFLAGVDIAGLAPSLALLLSVVGLTMFVVSCPIPASSNVHAVPRGAGLLHGRYAADGIDKSLSGQTDVGVELAVLAGFAVVTMAMGLWRKPWRET